MSNISNTKREKLNLIDSICEHCKVPSRFNHTMKKTLLKLSHRDIGNLALGIVVYKDKPIEEKTDQISYKCADEPSCLDCDDSKLDLYGDDCYCTKKRVTL